MKLEKRKRRRDESLLTTTQKMIFHNACVKSLDIHIVDCFGFFYNQFFNLSLHTCISKRIHHRNRSQSRAYKAVALYYNVQTFSFIRSGSSNHPALSINKCVSIETKGLTNITLIQPHCAKHVMCCHALLSCV